MGRHANGDSMSRNRRKRRSLSVSELWLIPLMKRYYEPNKPAIVAAGLVLLPICIRFVLPSIEISRFVMLPLKESLPQVWNVKHTWLTPSMLFVLLNLVIGTIAVTSSRGPTNGDNKKKKAGNIPRTNFDKHGETYDDDEEEVVEQPISRPLVEPSRPKKQKFPMGKPPNPPVFSQKTHRFSSLVEPPNPPGFLRKTHEFSPLIDPPKPPQFSGKAHEFSPPVEPTQSFSHVGKNKSKVPPSLNVLEVPHDEDMSSSVMVEDDTSPDGISIDELNAMADNFIQNFKQQLKLQRVQSFNERSGK